MPNPFRFCPPAAVLVVALAVCSVRAGDIDGIKEKLFQAKKQYDEETCKFRTAVSEPLDKREAARKGGDKKKAVDAVKSERTEFEQAGELSKAAPPALKSRPATAFKPLGPACAQAVKGYLKSKKDVEAEWKQLLASRPGAKSEVKDAYPIGTILVGQLKWSSETGGHNYLIVITERNGKAFRGVARLDSTRQLPIRRPEAEDT